MINLKWVKQEAELFEKGLEKNARHLHMYTMKHYLFTSPIYRDKLFLKNLFFLLHPIYIPQI